MTGGLIQLVSSGREDSYLTAKPQITFFKKVYRRHTIFGIELIQTIPDQQPEYNNRVSFIINNISDLISKCYIEIQIPTLSFTENPTITSMKQNELSNITKTINKWKTLYQNLNQFCSIEILLYQLLSNLLVSININLNVLKQNVNKFNSKYQKQKTSLINTIFGDVYNNINLSGYILQLELSIVPDNDPNYDSTINIYISDLQKNITGYYNNMIKYLKYYFTNWQFNQKKYNDLSNKNINFAWIENLAHYYFTNYEVEIGGEVVEIYSADQSYIYQMHHLKEEFKENYNQMIGNDTKLTTFNNSTKNSQTLILPLNFWFCKDIGSSLPTVALSNSSVAINLKLNKLSNLLYFQDYEQEYYNFLKITIPYDATINSELNVLTFDYNADSKLISYECQNINYQLMALQYPALTAVDKKDVLTNILNTYGINNSGEYVMELVQWLNYKQNFVGTTEQMNVLNRDALNNYNQYYSMVPKPTINLITESIYLDDLERTKFSSSKLEYVVELFQENEFDINNQILFNNELSITGPIKEIMWTTQPKTFLYGLSPYGKVYTSYNFNKFFINPIYSSFNISLNQLSITKSIYNYTFYNQLQSYTYYNNSLPENVYAYNFGLYPEEIQPSGTANFSMYKGKLINFTLNQSFLDEYFDKVSNPKQIGLLLKFYARSHNFFVVEKGMGKMIFSTF